MRVTFQNETSRFEGYYANFSISSEEQNYTLTYNGFYGHIRNALEDGFSGSGNNDSINGQPFCAPDKDCDECANTSGSGWWFNTGCSYVTPMAPMDQLVWPRNSEMVPVDVLQISLIANLDP